MPLTSGLGEMTPRGFTLLELLVVLAILALTATILPAAFSRAMPSRRVATVLSGLEVVVQAAQGWSLVRGEPVTLKLAPQAISCIGASGPLPNCRASWGSSTNVALYDSLNRSIKSLTVYSDGSSDGGHFLAQDGRHRGRLALSALTGRLTVDRKH